jgi:hypothetical protein
MPDVLYDHDILAWSRHQASLLRRVARGERVNGVDWAHVAEEIEDVGRSELNAVQSYLRQMLVNLLKVHGWPDNAAVDHWRGEIATFQADAVQRFTPSMRRRIAVPSFWEKACTQLAGLHYGGAAPRTHPSNCPFTLNDLLTGKWPDLETRLALPPDR